MFCKTKYRINHVITELLFLPKNLSDSNYNQIFNYEFGMQGPSTDLPIKHRKNEGALYGPKYAILSCT